MDSTLLQVQNSNLDLIVVENNYAICRGDEATFQVEARNGIPTYSYTWNGDSSLSNSFFGTTMAGLVSVSVTDYAGCVETIEFNAISSNVSFIVDSIIPISNVNLTADIYVNGVAGIAPYFYNWQDAQETNGNIGSYNSEGMKSLHIIDSIGCLYEAQVFVGQYEDSDLGLSAAIYSSFRTDNSSVTTICGQKADVFMHGAEFNGSARPFYIELTFATIDTIFSNPAPDYSEQLSNDKIRYYYIDNFSSLTLFNHGYLGNKYSLILCTNATCGAIFSMHVEFLEPDENIANDEYEVNFRYVCSVDPNDKVVSPEGICDSHYVEIDDLSLEYTIRFQNIGDIEANNVAIFDTLDATLDPATFEIISSSHSFTCVYLLESRILWIQYDNIQLPDSTSDEPGSHGYFSFKIKPFENINSGTSIENNAAIYFDTNLPIITNSVYNTLVDSLPNLNSSIIQIENMLETAQIGTSYFWYNCLNDTLVANTTTPQYEPTESGEYYVQITTGDCIYKSDCIQFVINNIPIIDNMNAIIYPNPANYKLQIKSEQEIFSITIADQLGKQVSESLINSKNGLLDISNLFNGIYTCSILLNNNKYIIRKFAVIK